MSRRPSMADDALSYPPYQSRPGAQSDVHSSAAGPGARTPYRPSSMVGAKQSRQGETQFLQAAQDVELTKEDKQEGYDTALLNLPERNTAAEGLPRLSSSSAAIVASTLPYAARAADHPLDYDKRRSAGAGGRDGGGKRGVRHHPSSAGQDHHRSRSSGGAGAKGGARKASVKGRRSKKRKLKWWQKPIALGALLGLLLVVGLAVGLGVGLTQGKRSRDSEKDRPTSAPRNVPSVSNWAPVGIEPSASGAPNAVEVQVSASAAAATLIDPASAHSDRVTIAVRPAVARETEPAVLKRREAARWQ
ncbi:hypothetical protein JCM3770_005667 [Rhodotorula araucariae]